MQFILQEISKANARDANCSQYVQNTAQKVFDFLRIEAIISEKFNPFSAQVK